MSIFFTNKRNFTPIVISSLITFLTCFAIWYFVSPHTTEIAKAGDNKAWRSEQENRIIEIYKNANKSVVFINTVTLTVDPFDFFQTIRPQTGSGSGIIVNAEQGIVITNLHVIQDAHKIEIHTDSSTPLGADLLGYDREYDIAVLKLKSPPRNLTSLTFGDSSNVEIGQTVLAIGNPFGLSRTLTTGIISSLGRTIRSPSNALMRGLIQTDAAINPGNSGGALLDLEGRLIGINSAILSQSGDSAGIGFAVPINEIKRFLPELITTGKISRPTVGWVLVDTSEGPMVRRVIPNSAAELKGVQPIERAVSSAFVQGFVRDFDRADLVYKIDGITVLSSEHANSIISQVKPIREIEVILKRGGRSGPERTIKITPELK
jgi:S1-C subfamily serine protease